MRRLHFALLAVLITLGSAPLGAATLGSVSGVVRDSGGVPQIGAVVELLRPDLSLAARVFTDDKGHFLVASVLPGRYSLKAMGAMFLPSLRENLRVRSNTVVNLTMNTLYEVMQWLPAEPRAANAQKDDWAWTLRSAANRPLLRWLEDGPLVVVTDGSGARPRLKARLMATGQEGTFGENGERFSAAVEDTPAESRELLARVDFAPNTNAGMESMLGFRQDLGFAGSVQSLAAISIHPEIDSGDTGGPAGLNEAAVRTSENLRFGDSLDAEVGSTEMLARLGGAVPDAVSAALPFASIGWRDGASGIRYRMTTMLPGASRDESQAAAYLPQVAERNGDLTFEHGLHQEIGWERRTESSGMAVLVYADKIDNQVIEASGRNADPIVSSALFDRASGLLHAAAPDYATGGMMATLERRLPNGNMVRLSYANGDALVMTAPSRPLPISQLVGAAHPRHAQTYSLSLSGTIEGTNTHWRASYRWQPADTVTQIAPFAIDAAEPYLNLHLRQPLRMRRTEDKGRIEALLDVRNLLAQGYRPYLLSDGSTLVFAHDQRAICAGLAFTF